MKYPNIYDNNFYDKINNTYKKYTIPKKKKSFKEYCFPKKYQLQIPQQFAENFLNPETPYKSLLIYHKIGSGKTCTAIRIAERWKHKRKIIVVLPASLKNNFRSELRSLCAGNSYLKQSERTELLNLHPNDNKYIDIINKSDDRIDKYYEIYSYNKFIDYIKDNQIKLNNCLLIIDEIQNMISEDGTYYTELFKLINKSSSDLRLVLLSATPMFDKPNELALTINLLRPEIKMPINKAFNKTFITTVQKKDGTIIYDIKNTDKFKKILKGYISYYRGAPSYVYPELLVKYVKCYMSDFQYNIYKSILRNEKKNETVNKYKITSFSQLPNNFFIGTRFVSNIVFPNKLINDDGFESLTKRQIINNLNIYSTKFYSIITKIMKTSGKIFIYSGFKEYAGLRSMIKILEAYNYKNYSEHGQGKKRFAVWSGDETLTYKEEIKNIYNLKENLDGSKIKIILGSSSIKEGISFYGVKQVHILEPYWNNARIEQIIGRASRFCSHKDLDLEKRKVKVYIYLAVHPLEDETVDEYIYQISKQKNELVHKFEKIIKEVAVDCTLNKNANKDEGDDYICEK